MTNIEQLMDALAGSDPDPDLVLSSFHRKRHRARTRMLKATGGAAAVVLAVVAGFALHGANLGGASASSSSSAPAAAPAAQGAANGGLNRSAAAAGSSGAASCAAAPLQSQLAAAIKDGDSVIVATGTLTGKVLSAPLSKGAPAYHAMTLASVRTLAGPAVASGSTAWIETASTESTVTPEGQALWARDGGLFAIVAPSGGTGAPSGPQLLRVAPVTGSQVIFSAAGCWSTAELPATRFSGSLAGPSGPVSFGPDEPTYAVPLADVEKIVAEAAKG